MKQELIRFIGFCLFCIGCAIGLPLLVDWLFKLYDTWRWKRAGSPPPAESADLPEKCIWCDGETHKGPCWDELPDNFASRTDWE